MADHPDCHQNSTPPPGHNMTPSQAAFMAVERAIEASRPYLNQLANSALEGNPTAVEHLALIAREMKSRITEEIQDATSNARERAEEHARQAEAAE